MLGYIAADINVPCVKLYCRSFAVCGDTHAHTHKQTHTHQICTYINARTRARARAHTHTHTRTHTHTHTHTHCSVPLSTQHLPTHSTIYKCMLVCSRRSTAVFIIEIYMRGCSSLPLPLPSPYPTTPTPPPTPAPFLECPSSRHLTPSFPVSVFVFRVEYL